MRGADTTFEALRERVLLANRRIVAHGLVALVWGNVSEIDRDKEIVAIKPSGVPLESMTADDISIVGLDGRIIHGGLRPSTDTPTHLALYRRFDEIGGVAHTHSSCATSWAQAEREIPVLGTTHADLSAYPIPVTRPLADAEIEADYERVTGIVISEAIGARPPLEVPCALVRGHGPFCWGDDASTAVENAITLEEVAQLAARTLALDPDISQLGESLRLKHYRRKHGGNAYYGQPQS